MRFEAEEIQYHDSTFCLHLWDSYHGTLSQELADRFINLCIYISHRDSTDHDRDFDHQVLKMFGGNRARGKICTIKFYPGTLVYWMPDTHLFSVLKTFTEFETVRIQFSDPSKPSTRKDLARMQNNMRPMRELLERGLGHAIPWIGKVHKSGVSDRTKKTVPFFNSLHFDNNYVYRKLLNIKILLFREIYNFITKTFIYKYLFEWNKKLLKEILVCCQAFVNHRRQSMG